MPFPALGSLTLKQDVIEASWKKGGAEMGSVGGQAVKLRAGSDHATSMSQLLPVFLAASVPERFTSYPILPVALRLDKRKKFS